MMCKFSAQCGIIIKIYTYNFLYLLLMPNKNLDATGKEMSNTEKEIEKVLRPAAFYEFKGQKKNY